MKTSAAQWAASMTAPTDDDLAQAETVVDKLAQEQAAKLVAEERAKQEALTRVEQLTAVIHRAEQRARAMDLTIAEKSERLAAAEAQGGATAPVDVSDGAAAEGGDGGPERIGAPIPSERPIQLGSGFARRVNKVA